MNITNRVVNLLKKLSGAEKINPDDNLQIDLGLDSLGMVTLMVELEEEFQFELNQSDMNPFELILVSHVVDLIARYLGGNDEKNS